MRFGPAIGSSRPPACGDTPFVHDTLRRAATSDPQIAMPLTKNQLRFLRGLAHDLKPIIHVGAKGMSDALLGELDAALEHHELVKVKIGAEDRDGRDDIAESLAARSGAETVQRIGHTVTLYRRSSDKPKLELPR
jgi:RNA-binding protein